MTFLFFSRFEFWLEKLFHCTIFISQCASEFQSSSHPNLWKSKISGILKNDTCNWIRSNNISAQILSFLSLRDVTWMNISKVYVDLRRITTTKTNSGRRNGNIFLVSCFPGSIFKLVRLYNVSEAFIVISYSCIHNKVKYMCLFSRCKFYNMFQKYI